MIIQREGFYIKDTDVKDIESILQIYKQCEDFLSLGPVPNASKQMVLDDLELSQKEVGVFCGIYIEGKMIGIVDFVLDNFEGKPNTAFISLLMISSYNRRKGIGRDVVKAVEYEILKNSSIETILSGVQVNNQPAIDFWIKMGYKIISGPELLPDSTIVFGLKKEVRR
jgi:ribosomal protein S18 acetylase RimI-like enzyme